MSNFGYIVLNTVAGETGYKRKTRTSKFAFVETAVGEELRVI